jgi:hypothetical protein
LAVGVGLAVSNAAQAEIRVSGPKIDDTTGGAWSKQYGKCFHLLPGPVAPFEQEPVGPDYYSVAPEQYANDCSGGAAADIVTDFRVYRDGEIEAFEFHAPPPRVIPISARQDPGCRGGVLGAARGTTWSNGDSQIGKERPLVSELMVDFTGSLTLAYYFVNRAEKEGPPPKPECRTQDFWLYINDLLVSSGTVGNFRFGKYVVFEVDGLEGPAAIRFETERSLSDECSVLGTPGVDYQPEGNDVLSGVFVNCDPGGGEPCKLLKKQVSVDGGQTWADADGREDAVTTEMGAEYRLIVTNCEDVPLKVLKIVDWRLRLYKWFWNWSSREPALILGPGEQVTLTKDDPGFEKLDQPYLCRRCLDKCWLSYSRCGEHPSCLPCASTYKVNAAWVVGFYYVDGKWVFARDKDLAVVKCKPVIAPAPEPQKPTPICTIFRCDD